MIATSDPSLLPKSGENSPLGKIVNWLSSVGRYIVIFTELIVISAFLSRFWLDRRNTDLSETIRQEKAILESTMDFEKEFNLFKARIEAIAKGLAEEKSLLEPLDIVASNIPPDIVIQRYSFVGQNKNEITMLVLVFSESSLSEFIKRLTNVDEVRSVKIGNVERQEGTVGMKVQVSIGLDFERKKDETK